MIGKYISLSLHLMKIVNWKIGEFVWNWLSYIFRSGFKFYWKCFYTTKNENINQKILDSLFMITKCENPSMMATLKKKRKMFSEIFKTISKEDKNCNICKCPIIFIIAVFRRLSVVQTFLKVYLFFTNKSNTQNLKTISSTFYV